MNRLSIITFSVLLIAGCATKKVIQEQWPSGIPAKSHYQQLYILDKSNHSYQTEEEYLKWVVVFFKGFNLISGWHDITDEVLANLENERHVEVSKKMASLGNKISGEWAKLTPERVIFNHSVSAWSAATRIASERNELEILIDKITKDVNALFTGKLEPDLIRLERYYKDQAELSWP